MPRIVQKQQQPYTHHTRALNIHMPHANISVHVFTHRTTRHHVMYHNIKIKMMKRSNCRCSLSTSTIVSVISLLTLLVCIASVKGSNNAAGFHSRLDRSKKPQEDIVVTKIEPEDDEHARRLAACADYQYKVQILDDLMYMYYVANVNTRIIDIKFEFFGEAWISLGTNRWGKGDMIGSEAWMALPNFPVSLRNPGTYVMTTETVAGVTLSSYQMLSDGTMEQSDGVTTTTFSRPYKDFFLINQPVNVTDGPNEFVWAHGFSNVYDAEIHERAGHFTLQVEECDEAVITEPIEVDKVKRRCGLLGDNIFCPFTLCGFFGRLFDFCGIL